MSSWVRSSNACDSYCLVGIAVMVFSIIYWAGWWIILPRIFRYKLVAQKDTLRDGTVITVVSLAFTLWTEYCGANMVLCT